MLYREENTQHLLALTRLADELQNWRETFSSRVRMSCTANLNATTFILANATINKHHFNSSVRSIRGVFWQIYIPYYWAENPLFLLALALHQKHCDALWKKKKKICQMSSSSP